MDLEFKNENELWNYIEKNYDEESMSIILDISSYYEIEYGNNYVRNADIERYNRAKAKDITGEFDILAKKNFELIKPQIYINMNRNNIKKDNK